MSIRLPVALLSLFIGIAPAALRGQDSAFTVGVRAGVDSGRRPSVSRSVHRGATSSSERSTCKSAKGFAWRRYVSWPTHC